MDRFDMCSKMFLLCENLVTLWTHKPVYKPHMFFQFLGFSSFKATLIAGFVMNSEYMLPQVASINCFVVTSVTRKVFYIEVYGSKMPFETFWISCPVGTMVAYEILDLIMD